MGRAICHFEKERPGRVRLDERDGGAVIRSVIYPSTLTGCVFSKRAGKPSPPRVWV